MAGEGKGWISLYRSIQDHWLWQERPFSKGQAWLDLLLLANHKDNKFLLGNELIKVKKGSFITSQKKLRERWGWGNEKVRSFLKLLEEDGMIKQQADKKKTVITIVKYEEFQTGSSIDIQMDSEEGQTTIRPETDCKQTGNRPLADTNNNDNNVNNDNKYINNNITPIEVYQNNIFPMPGAIEIQGINNWSNDLGNELVIYAIEIAAENNARSWKYIEHTLMDWNDNNIKTLDQAKAYSQHRKRKGGQKQNGGDRKDNSENKREYNFNRPYTGPSHNGEIDF